MDSEMTLNEEKMKEAFNDPFFVFMILAILSAFPGECKDEMKSILNKFAAFCNEREAMKKEMENNE